MMETSSRYYLVITLVLLLDIATASILRNTHFRNIEKHFGEGEELWVTQKLDHFDPNNEQTWQQRYYKIEVLASNKRDVAYLYIYGQDTAFDVPFSGWVYDARNTHPVLFALEHRYYGGSHPTEDLSTENLKYLSSQQALADIADFIKATNTKHNLAPNVKWVIFGGFYAGNLAAWARKQYPELVFAAVSSSAPLQAKFDYSEYYKLVADGLHSRRENCLDSVQEAYKQLEELLNDADNRHKLNDLFQLCSDIEMSIDKPLDMSSFYSIIAGYFGEVAIYNSDQRIDKESFPNTEKICDIFTNSSIGSELDRLATFAKLLIHKLDYIAKCIPISYETRIKRYTDKNYNSYFTYGDRQWLYQQCTEFGFYPTSSYEPHIFGNNFGADYFIQICQDVFSPAFNKTFVENAVAKTNNLYHGLDIQVDNVIFGQGTLDPWYPLGLKKPISERSPLIVIEGGSNCQDSGYPIGNESPELLDAKLKIEKIIFDWITNSNSVASV